MYNKYFQNKSFTYFYALTSLLFMHYLGGLPQISSGEQQSCHKSSQIILHSQETELQDQLQQLEARNMGRSE